MQPALQYKCRLVMEQPGRPVLVAEHQFAGEKDAVGKVLLDSLGQLHQFVDAVGTKRKSRGRGKAVGMAVVDVERERTFERGPQAVTLLAATVALRIDCLGADENEVAKMVRKQSLHPQQRMNPAATARPDDEHGG